MTDTWTMTTLIRDVYRALMTPFIVMSAAREFKSRAVAQRQKNNVISGFK